jgi:hypothetical protein
MDLAKLCIAFAASALLIRALPSVPVRRVLNYIFITARTYFFPTSLRGHYLSAAQGRTRHLSVRRRRILWQQAFFYIARIIRLRKRWSALSRHILDPRIPSLNNLRALEGLVSGVTSRNLLLARVRNADRVGDLLPRAKARAQIQQRFAASSSASR